MVVRISSKLHAELLAVAEKAPDEEICGLLFGSEGLIEAFQKMRNFSNSLSDQFEIDPAQLIAAHRAARSGGPQLVGHFHSHPNGVCRPSSCDADRAAADGMLWLIIAGGQIGGWRAVAEGSVHGRFDPITLHCEG
jgi:desampylase